MGISGNEINYRGVSLPLPQPFLIRPCDLILSIRCCAEAIYHPSALSILRDGGMPGGTFSGIRRTNHPCTNGFRGQSVAILYGIWRDANPNNIDDVVGVLPSLLIVMHRQSIRTMILPVGAGRQEGIPSPNFNLIVASEHSPLSFASRRWSPQHSILGTQSLHWLATGWSHDPSHTSTSHNSHGLDSRQSRSGSSDGRKALGVDGRSIALHPQIQWVYINSEEVPVTTSHGRSSSSASDSVSPTDPIGLDGAH